MSVFVVTPTVDNVTGALLPVRQHVDIYVCYNMFCQHEPVKGLLALLAGIFKAGLLRC